MFFYNEVSIAIRIDVWDSNNQHNYIENIRAITLFRTQNDGPKSSSAYLNIEPFTGMED